MHAYRLILTHFSQRYPSVPALPPGSVDYVLLAFDYMRMRFQDLLWAPSVMPALVEAFPPGVTENENDDDAVEPYSTETQKDKERDREGGKESAQGKNKEGGKKRKAACRCHEWTSEIESERGGTDGAGSQLDTSSAAFKVCGVCLPSNGGPKSEMKSNGKKVPKTSG